jgi:hypothetical protein
MRYAPKVRAYDDRGAIVMKEYNGEWHGFTSSFIDWAWTGVRMSLLAEEVVKELGDEPPLDIIPVEVGE